MLLLLSYKNAFIAHNLNKHMKLFILYKVWFIQTINLFSQIKILSYIVYMS